MLQTLGPDVNSKGFTRNHHVITHSLMVLLLSNLSLGLYINFHHTSNSSKFEKIIVILTSNITNFIKVN